MYETALRLSKKEKMTSDIAIMNREFGRIYGHSGRADATSRAIDHLEIAQANMPHDPICAKVLANFYETRGQTAKIIDILTPFLSTPDKRTKQTLFPILLRAYHTQPDKYMLEITELKRRLS